MTRTNDRSEEAVRDLDARLISFRRYKTRLVLAMACLLTCAICEYWGTHHEYAGTAGTFASLMGSLASLIFMYRKRP